MADLRSKIFAALTGQQSADVSGKADGDLAGMLLAIGGPSSRTQSGIDLSKAASALNVSRRTVERWVRTAQTGSGQRPSAAHATTLATRSRQAATTRAGRIAALGGRRQPLGPRGARVSVTGLQGPRAAGKGYLRQRMTQVDLDPADAQAMIDAWVAGGDKGFMTWARDHWDQEYVAGWDFSSIDQLEVQEPYGGSWR